MNSKGIARTKENAWGQKKTTRNEHVYRYHLAHPEMKHKVLARIFKVSRARITQILNQPEAPLTVLPRVQTKKSKATQECALCGALPPFLKTGGLIEHHDSYDEPVKTRTLCRSCHANVHIKLRSGSAK
jgi:hypothetical protein